MVDPLVGTDHPLMTPTPRRLLEEMAAQEEEEEQAMVDLQRQGQEVKLQLKVVQHQHLESQMSGPHTLT